jgi:acetylornithine deacetylase/succinyl-diaminopimelate desuccinylase-like protein
VPRYGSRTERLPEPAVDWEALEVKARALLIDLVREDTTNPPGKEAAAAEKLAQFLARAGVEARVVEAAPGRASVFARIRATRVGTAPLVLLSHLDVHPADADAWPKETAPFDGRIVDGVLHGRGVLDGKGLAVLHAAAMVALAKAPLARDVVMISTADGARGEELGIRSVVGAFPEVATATIALGEGGYTYLDLFDDVVVHGVAEAEKGYAIVEVAAVSRGAADRPAPVKLSDGLTVLFDQQRPPRLVKSVARTFDHLADAASWPKSTVLSSGFLTRLMLMQAYAGDPATAPYFMDTIEVSTLRSGRSGGRNTPERARAVLTAELLPGRRPGVLQQEIRAWIGDPDLHVTISSGAEATSSPTFEPLLRAVSDRAAKPGEVVAPMLGLEATDARVLRRLGVRVYGFVPIPVTREDLESIRGRNEKLPLDRFANGMRIMTSIVADLSRESLPGRES